MFSFITISALLAAAAQQTTAANFIKADILADSAYAGMPSEASNYYPYSYRLRSGVPSISSSAEYEDLSQALDLNVRVEPLNGTWSVIHHDTKRQVAVLTGELEATVKAKVPTTHALIKATAAEIDAMIANGTRNFDLGPVGGSLVERGDCGFCFINFYCLLETDPCITHPICVILSCYDSS